MKITLLSKQYILFRPDFCFVQMVHTVLETQIREAAKRVQDTAAKANIRLKNPFRL